MKLDKTKLSRRTFMQAAGLTGASWFLPSLGQAAEPATSPPRRVVFLLCELGWNPFDFRMKPADAPQVVLDRSGYHPTFSNRPDDLRWELDLRRTPRDQFSRILDPIYEVREHAIALDGLGMHSIGTDNHGDAHARGILHRMAGFPSGRPRNGPRSYAGMPTIDQRIARHLRENNDNLTDLVSLAVSVSGRSRPGSSGQTNFHDHLYGFGPEGGEPVVVPYQGRPRDVYERLFPNAGQTDRSVVDKSQLSVLDRLQARYQAVLPKLSKQDRDKLDLHRQMIRDVERRMSILENSSCRVPGEPAEDTSPRVTSKEWFDRNMEAMYQLVVTAMACDLTRVAVIDIPNRFQQERFGASDKDFHHYYSHGTKPSNKWFGVEGSRVDEESHNFFNSASAVLGEKNREQVGRAVTLANMLKEVPEGDGTMLDNTLIVLMEEISHGSHGHDQWPVLLLGGFGGAVRPGRYIRLPRTNRRPGMSAMGDFTGVPHSHMLISICQAMGMPLEHLGIQYVRADSQTISLRGPLHELT